MKLQPKYIGIFVVLIMSWFIWQIFQESARIRQSRQSGNVPIQSQDGSKPKAELKNFEQIEGTDILRAELTIAESSELTPSYKPYNLPLLR
jgi:hypothetical protein